MASEVFKVYQIRSKDPALVLRFKLKWDPKKLKNHRACNMKLIHTPILTIVHTF